MDKNPKKVVFKVKHLNGFYSRTRVVGRRQINESGKTKIIEAKSSASATGKTRELALQRAKSIAEAKVLEKLNKLQSSGSKSDVTNSTTTQTDQLSYNSTVSSVAPTTTSYTDSTSGITYTGVYFATPNTISFGTTFVGNIICTGDGGYADAANFDSGLGGGGVALLENIVLSSSGPYTLYVNSDYFELAYDYTSCSGGAAGYGSNAGKGENTLVLNGGTFTSISGGKGGSGGNSTPDNGENASVIGINVPFLPPVSSGFNFYFSGGGGGSKWTGSGPTDPGAPGFGTGGLSGENYNATYAPTYGFNIGGFGAGAGGADGDIGDWPASAPGCLIIYFAGSCEISQM